MEIKTLATDMKLLTVTSETVNYQNILSILDSKYEEMHVDMDADVDTNALKEKLSPFVAFECKFNASEIEEYWYCDHPYLVDRDLRKSLKTNAPIDRLDAEIEASGKLQLLDKLLLEIKRRRLRVLVLFQSVVRVPYQEFIGLPKAAREFDDPTSVPTQQQRSKLFRSETHGCPNLREGRYTRKGRHQIPRRARVFNVEVQGKLPKWKLWTCLSNCQRMVGYLDTLRPSSLSESDLYQPLQFH
ncbi:hypothetical protein L2E82_28344 [Cichorium intybus]|uniref:Uncharacterized protein n=1 Tax=Cichorium intybus TaxID=13427 RepID=A0ACB9CVJ4_CICIN|nr:hypothetical protein L2E82_28344 [Cichorium intybus]